MTTASQQAASDEPVKKMKVCRSFGAFRDPQSCWEKFSSVQRDFERRWETLEPFGREDEKVALKPSTDRKRHV